MIAVSIDEAKTDLSHLLSCVAAGEEVVISEHGKPVARLVPYLDTLATRVLGLDKGRMWIAEDFNAPLPEEILNSFES